MPDAAVEEWTISDELAQRLGCGVLSALTLPVWFLLLSLAVQSTLALGVSVLLLLASVAVGLVVLRRNRRLPRTVQLDVADHLVTVARAGRVSRPLADLRTVEIGTSLGVWPMRLGFADGSTLRLPRELGDLDALLAALRRRCPGVLITDKNVVSSHNVLTDQNADEQ